LEIHKGRCLSTLPWEMLQAVVAKMSRSAQAPVVASWSQLFQLAHLWLPLKLPPPPPLHR